MGQEGQQAFEVEQQSCQKIQSLMPAPHLGENLPR